MHVYVRELDISSNGMGGCMSMLLRKGKLEAQHLVEGGRGGGGSFRDK